jgi:MerR family copper efflux transcriptional regulator
MKKLNEYMLIEEAASFIGVTSNTLRNWEKSEKLLSYRNPVNGYRLYKKEDLEKLLEKVRVQK